VEGDAGGVVGGVVEGVVEGVVGGVTKVDAGVVAKEGAHGLRRAREDMG